MTPEELRAGASLAAIFGLRMLGLFFILPVFAIHAHTLRGGQDLGLVGIAIGGYGLAQGILQIPYGMASDRWGRKGLIVAGMWIQSAGLFLTAATRQFEWWLAGSLLLGVGTAMVYPSLIAAVSDASHPTWRARSLSVYRFWRDLGYAIGALSAGVIADIFGMAWAIGSIAGLTFLSGMVVALAMREKTRGGPDVAQSIEPNVGVQTGLHDNRIG